MDWNRIRRLAQERYIQAIVQREEILQAFIAKYQYAPDEIEQVIQHNGDGSISFYVRKKEVTE